MKDKFERLIEDINHSQDVHDQLKQEHLKEIDALAKETEEASKIGKQPVVDSLRDFHNFKGVSKYIDISKLKNKGVIY